MEPLRSFWANLLYLKFPQNTSKLVDALRGHVLTLAQQVYGCYVIRKALESITNELSAKVSLLFVQEYGSRVIQHVIEHGLPEDRGRIVRSLQGGIMKYAQDKFGSPVISKCLACGTADQKRALFDTVCVGGPGTLQNARQLMADEFGTFVIQKFFECGTEDQKARLVDALRGHALELALHVNGSHVIETALKSITNQCPVGTVN
uniref:PUM-HD domain-containing protein n=1 Tax=Globodera rostochiensis TaxID=31243 RepID=A0A914I2Y7_GLORO